MHPVNEGPSANAKDPELNASKESDAGGSVQEPIINHRMLKFYQLFPAFTLFTISDRTEFLRGSHEVQSRYRSSVPAQFHFTMQLAIAISNMLREEYRRVEALPGSTLDKFSTEPYKLVQLYAEDLASAEEDDVWLGDMFDMSERANPVVARTLEKEAIGVHRKRTSEEVTGDLSMREAKRSKQE
uniref:Uncharacterized protein n=1 Tax=Moniliophthora roreri TaxID=221103 RepID=A0A0W0G6I2_MONRR